MFTFNDFIREQCLTELPIKGRNFTWSNMQQTPSLNSSIGSSHHWIGRPHSLTLLWCPSDGLFLTILHAMSPFKPPFRKLDCLGLKPFGLHIRASSTLSHKLGTSLSSMGEILMRQLACVKSLRIFDMLSAVGVKVFLVWKLPLKIQTKPYLRSII